MMKMKELHAAYRDFLYQFFLKHVKVPSLAEDFAQDVFMKFWENKGRHQDINNLDAWLYTLAHNHLTDHYRKLATEKKYQETVWHQMERQSNTLLLDIYKKELEIEIEDLLNTLSSHQREVYLLSRSQGMSLDKLLFISIYLQILPKIIWYRHSRWFDRFWGD